MTIFSRLILVLLLTTPAFATKEPDSVIQQAFEELASFSETREIVWDVDHSGHDSPWTVIMRYDRKEGDNDHWIIWTVTNPSLKSAVVQIEKDVYSFPDGHKG